MPDEPPPRVARAANCAMTALFLVVIAMPMLCRPLGLGTERLAENRLAVTCPKPGLGLRALARFPARFEAYFNDSLAFRARFIRMHNYVKVFWLRVSPSPFVFLGDDGWLYYAGERDLDSFRHLAPFSKAQLEAWRRVYESRRDWLARRGIRYLVTIAPSKHVVYPEHVPGRYRVVWPQSRYDQLLAHLREHSDLEFLDLRGPLLEAKPSGLLYYTRDTHWNMRGAFVAYQAIVGRVGRWFPAVQALPRSAFDEFDRPRPGPSDLTQLLGLEPFVHDEEAGLLPTVPFRAHLADARALAVGQRCIPGQEPLATEVDAPGLPRAVMFRDSFTQALAPFLSEHFGRIAYIWHRPFDTAIIEKERPQIVIETLVDRVLWREIPAPLDLPVDSIATRPREGPPR